MKYEEAQEQLQKLGKQLCVYCQANNISANHALRGKVARGMCAGATLDWLQMVLRGSEAHKIPGDESSMEAFAAQVPAGRSKFYDMRKLQLKQHFNEQESACDKDIADMGDKLQARLSAVFKSPGMTQARYDKMEAEATILYDKEVEKTKAKYVANKNRINAELETPDLHRQFWVEFGKVMDTKVTTAGYSKLNVEANCQDMIYGPPNGVLALCKKLIGHDKFHPGCGAMLAVAPIAAGSGHAVGIRKLNTGGFHFFDPNFGVYALDLKNLYRSILFLFLNAYPTLENGNTHDNRQYEIDGKVAGEFLIYAASATTPHPVDTKTTGATA